MAIIAGVAAIVAGFYLIVDPAASPFAPKCFFRMLTGWECPGCGSQRMLHALLHGEMGAAWKANPFLLCALPGIAFWIWVDIVPDGYPRLYKILNSVPFIIGVLTAIIIWGVVRNLV